MTHSTLRELFYSHEDRLIHKWDHYFEIYEKYLATYTGQKINMLEIGISHGGSLQLWKKYFGNQVNIFAIDINPQCKQFEDEQTRIFIGSQSDRSFMHSVAAQIPEMDFILDDGGHTMEQQKTSFEILFSKVKEGGLYMVEDTHTSYWREYHGGLKNQNSFIEYGKRFIDTLYTFHIPGKEKLKAGAISQHINCISFYDSIVVFEKQKRPQPFHIRRGHETIEPYIPTELKKPALLAAAREKLFGKVLHPFAQNDKGKA